MQTDIIVFISLKWILKSVRDISLNQLLLPLSLQQDSGPGSSSSESRHGRKASKSITTSSAHLAGGGGGGGEGGRATSLSGSLPGMIYASSFDLTSSLAKNDYFSDINPRSMRRLMNIVAVTGETNKHRRAGQPPCVF